MLPSYFIVIAVVLRLFAGAAYMRATLQGRAKPSLVSWFFWGVTGCIAFVVQLIKGAGPEAFVTLAIALSPLAVCAAAVYKGVHRTKLTVSDKWSIVLTVTGIILWLISQNPVMALGMSIIADICSNIPTLAKSYRRPYTEYARAYAISMVSMIIALLTITTWDVTHWLFPAYILAINGMFVLTIKVLSKLRRRQRAALPSPQFE